MRLPQPLEYATMASYVISSRAYFKIFFHAAKHPHQPVNGVLVGKEEAGIVTIVDIMPSSAPLDKSKPYDGDWFGIGTFACLSIL